MCYFPIDEVTWDYQMMPARTSANEAEAVIVAIKKEVIEAEVEAVERVGLKIKQVEVAPFALLNAFRYSEPPNRRAPDHRHRRSVDEPRLR